MIRVTINKKETDIDEGITVERFLKDSGNPKAAVWINGTQLLKSDYKIRIIGQGDDIKILRIVAGG